MLGISDLVLSPRIVDDGEEGNDFDVGTGVFCQPQTVLNDSGPVRNAVVAVDRQSVVIENDFEDEIEIHSGIVPVV